MAKYTKFAMKICELCLLTKIPAHLDHQRPARKNAQKPHLLAGLLGEGGNKMVSGLLERGVRVELTNSVEFPNYSVSPCRGHPRI